MWIVVDICLFSDKKKDVSDTDVTEEVPLYQHGEFSGRLKNILATDKCKAPLVLKYISIIILILLVANIILILWCKYVYNYLEMLL